ncbi:MAG: hypothetical protein ACLFWL_11795 [Candidatus Brocadiia bacterium]
MSGKIVLTDEDANLVLAAITIAAKSSDLNLQQRACLRNLEKDLRRELRDHSKLRLDGAAVSVILKTAMFALELIKTAT